MFAFRRSLLLAGVGGGLLLGGAAVAQAVSGQDAALLQPYTLERSAVVDLPGSGGENYSIMVAWPEGDPPASGWPVLYVLDGEDNFATFALTARRLARAGARSGIAPGIVVGVGAGPLERRVRDYTPAIPGYRIPAGKPAAGLETGGAETFLDFLERDVMPMVHKRWKVDQNRETLVGHSFGGLLALDAMLTRPAMFDRAVAVSPSFWFGDGFLAREAARKRQVPGGSVLIATGEQETGAAGAAQAFIDALPRSATAGIRRIDLPGQSHGSTMLAALPRAISEAFGKEGS